MVAQQFQPRFAWLSTVVALSATAGLLFAAGWMLFPVMLEDPSARNCLIFAGSLVIPISLIALLPIVVAGPLGLMPTVYAAFGSMAFRLMVCLAGTLYANHVLGMARIPLVTAMMWFYLPLMFVEMGCIARYIWRKDQWVSTMTHAKDAVAASSNNQTVGSEVIA